MSNDDCDCRTSHCVYCQIKAFVAGLLDDKVPIDVLAFALETQARLVRRQQRAA
jgi:hypothetical protein